MYDPIALADFDEMARRLDRIYIAAIHACAGEAIGLADMVDLLTPGYI